MTEQLHVGIAEYKIAKNPTTLTALGLGSCVGTIIYDEKNQIGGLSHIMLPDSELFKTTQLNPAKFANLALPKMVEELKQAGANGVLKAKIAGGAQMFKVTTNTNQLNIGQRNVIAVKQALESLNIKLVSEHVGGTKGRTMIVDLDNFDTTIRIVHDGIIHI